MSNALLDARLAAALGPLAIAQAERDGDGLLLADPARGELLYLSPVMALWLADPAFAAAVRAAEPSATEAKVEMQGGRREFSLVQQPVSGPQGERWLAAVWRDLGPARQRETRLRQALDQIEQQQLAYERLQQETQGATPRDSASGLFHRAHFEDQLRREVDLSTREHREFALVTIEIDPPLPEAGPLGVAAYERVVQTLGRLLRANTRAMDASCRWDERRFAVLLSGVGLATAHSRMEGLRRQCATQIVAVEGRDLGFTVSMGVASFPHTAQSQDELVSICEAALAEARQRGGNRVTLASIRFEPT
jgi:diguanylate cyclase (GGDEF)-like protein